MRSTTLMPDSRPLRALASAALLLAGCGDPGGQAGTASDRAPGVERHERAGTEYVRNFGTGDGPIVLHEELRIGSLEGPAHEAFGSVDAVVPDPEGGFAILDARSFRVHRYDAEGTHLGSFGSQGDGPGEFSAPSGMTRLPQGGFALVEGRGTGQLHLYSADGAFLEGHRIPVGPTGSPIAQRDGTVLVPFRMQTEEGTPGSVTALLAIDLQGEGFDTIRPPRLDVNPAWTIHVRDEVRRTGFEASVPFTPRAISVRHPEGLWVVGTGERYELFQLTDEGDTVRVIEREAARAPVDPDEAGHARERVLAGARGVDPEWRWTASEIPAEKPFFRNLIIGADGSIGVWRHVAGQRAELPPELADLPPGRGPPAWVEPPVLDLFDPVGRYVGTLALPVGTGLMSFSLEHAWLRETDELGVPQVIRARLELLRLKG